MYKEPSLCVPDEEKSCFACCPPIRPAGYEHVQYKNIIKRMLRENTLSFQPERKPITGFSCWALGYIDKDFKRIGCLLHPARNKGVDLRKLTGYGEKCRRESCAEARIFGCLKYRTKSFWLQLTGDLDSFSYSSRIINPIFRLLRWGKSVLEDIAKRENYGRIELSLLKEKYPFLKSRVDPRGIAYPVKLALEKGKVVKLSEIEDLMATIRNRYEICSTSGSDKTFYVHILEMDKDFLDFLRLGLSVKEIVPVLAVRIKNNVDYMLSKMCISSYL